MQLSLNEAPSAHNLIFHLLEPFDLVSLLLDTTFFLISCMLQAFASSLVTIFFEGFTISLIFVSIPLLNFCFFTSLERLLDLLFYCLITGGSF